MPEVRLIDANALKDRIDSAFTTYGECTYVKGIIDAQPTIEADIDRAEIMRLCNEIEDIVSEISNNLFRLQVNFG